MRGEMGTFFPGAEPTSIQASEPVEAMRGSEEQFMGSVCVCVWWVLMELQLTPLPTLSHSAPLLWPVQLAMQFNQTSTNGASILRGLLEQLSDNSEFTNPRKQGI